MRRRGREPIDPVVGMPLMIRLCCACPQPERILPIICLCFCAPPVTALERAADGSVSGIITWLASARPHAGHRRARSPAPRLAALACGIAQLPPKVADTQATDALGFISAGLGRLLYLCLLVCARFHAGEPGAGRRTATHLRAIGRAISRRPYAARAQRRKDICSRMHWADLRRMSGLIQETA